MASNVTEKELQSYIIDRIRENGFTVGNFEKMQGVLGTIKLMDKYADYGSTMTGFDEFVDELIDEVLHGRNNPNDENPIYDAVDDFEFEDFDPRYDREGFIRQRRYKNDELPDGFDNSGDPLQDISYDEEDDGNDGVDWSVFDDKGTADMARRLRMQRKTRERNRQLDSQEHAEQIARNREKEQKRFEAESARNRAKRLACKTPEELYNFKVKMGWITGVNRYPHGERERYIQSELAKCAREIAMRDKVEEAFTGPYWLRPFVWKHNK